MATHSVLVHLSPTRFTTGFYRLEGDTLTMTYDDGTPVEPLAIHHMRPGDDAKVIAGILTKEIRSRMSNPFWDDMSLPETGIA